MLPLTEVTFFILLSLTPNAHHGYAIMQEVLELSHQRVKLSTGTLYTALKRLLDDGWIEQVEGEDKSRGKKIYRLTPTGYTILREETERLAILSSLARGRLSATS
jgi:DNA-binding PadR family transcriptional regulator